MRHVLLAAAVVAAFGFATAPVQADDHTAVEVTGACWYDSDGDGTVEDDEGAEDGASVNITSEAIKINSADEENVEDGLAACQSAAENGDQPASGSHLTVTVTLDGDSTSLSTNDVVEALP